MLKPRVHHTPASDILTKAELDLLERHRSCLQATYELSFSGASRRVVDPAVSASLESRIDELSKGLNSAGKAFRRDLRLGSLEGKAKADFDRDR